MSDTAHEAQAILLRAKALEDYRERQSSRIDYEAAAREFRKQKAALTRAVNSGDRDRIVIACRNAVVEWNQPNRAWPDDWARWQCALDDAFPVFQAPRLEDLT